MLCEGRRGVPLAEHRLVEVQLGTLEGEGGTCLLALALAPELGLFDHGGAPIGGVSSLVVGIGVVDGILPQGERQ